MTDLAALMVTWQEPVPVQAPLQPAKAEPAAGAWLRVTTVPELKLALQVAPQLMPVGEEVTVPLPVPAFATVRAYDPEGDGSAVATASILAWSVAVRLGEPTVGSIAVRIWSGGVTVTTFAAGTGRGDDAGEAGHGPGLQ